MSLTSSYLDHLDARLEKQGGRSSLSRLLLVARRGEAADDPDAVVRYHERVSVRITRYSGVLITVSYQYDVFDIRTHHTLIWMTHRAYQVQGTAVPGIDESCCTYGT